MTPAGGPEGECPLQEGPEEEWGSLWRFGACVLIKWRAWPLLCGYTGLRAPHPTPLRVVSRQRWTQKLASASVRLSCLLKTGPLR